MKLIADQAHSQPKQSPANQRFFEERGGVQ